MADQVLHPTWIRPFQGEEEVFLDPEPEGAGPVSFALSESVISDSFLDYLEIEVSGLSLGQTVRLERFLVNN